MNLIIRAFFLVSSITLLFGLIPACNAQDEPYNVGVGIADITGPSAEVELWGYATFKQPGRGIHFRLYSRTVIVSKGDTRVALITTDLGSVSEILKVKVVEKLQEKYDKLYRMDNVVISAIHTHSAPGGLHQYVLYTIPSEGFIRQTFDAALEGIVRSVVLAHNNIKPARLFINSGTLLDSNYNRSPSAYANNPEEERNQYEYNVDKTMTVLKITDTELQPIGAMSWFAVHPTSMNNTNKLVSGDNKGYASMLMEREFNGNNSIPGTGPFVAVFPQQNHADTSPNIMGSRCIDTGLPCDYLTSTCNGKNAMCIAMGPGKDMFDSTKIIGSRQYEKAVELYNTATEELQGSLRVIHQHIDMTNHVINTTKSSSGKAANQDKTCKPALGYSFGAGTTDGPGASIFTQGNTQENSFFNFIRYFIKSPSTNIKICQAPKPILLATGEINFPYTWQPAILPTQLIQIGQLVITPVPAEFTTMSGRRMAKAIKKIYDQETDMNVTVLVQSLSNEYSSYVATYEEYQIQRYEGASTIYGPHTLAAYIEQYEFLAENMLKGNSIPQGPEPPNLLSKQVVVKPGVIYDTAGIGVNFGDVTKDVSGKYKPGETVSVTFVSGHPRNDLKLGSTYLTIEQFNKENKSWKIVATDANWETKFRWERTNSLFGISRATVEWKIPADTEPGVYRIRHFGAKKGVLQKITSYSGTSSSFKIYPKASQI